MYPEPSSALTVNRQQFAESKPVNVKMSSEHNVAESFVFADSGDASQRIADTGMQEFGECTGNDTCTQTPIIHDSGIVHKRQRPARDNMSARSTVANNASTVSVYIQYLRRSSQS